MGIFDQIAHPMSSKLSSSFTEKQGQYLAFIHTYTLLNRQPPAEADFQRFFGVTPPAVHDMIVGLERRGLISRVPRQPRSIQLLVSAADVPQLQSI
jgi:DNA-binding MarR family transcriptional regulator